MRRRYGEGWWPGTLPGRSVGRWIVVAIGLAVLVGALAGAAEPYGRTSEFRQVVACEEHGGACFDHETASIVERHTYTTTSTQNDANGVPTTTTTTHYEVTWQRADGSRQGRDVAASFYDAAREGQPSELRLWRGEVVGVQVAGADQRFVPESGTALGWWLLLAFLGLGVLLWGLLLGWWDGVFLLLFRTFAWMFMAIVPVNLATDALAYGLEPGLGLAFTVGFGIAAIGIAGWLLAGSFDV